MSLGDDRRQDGESDTPPAAESSSPPSTAASPQVIVHADQVIIMQPAAPNITNSWPDDMRIKEMKKKIVQGRRKLYDDEIPLLMERLELDVEKVTMFATYLRSRPESILYKKPQNKPAAEPDSPAPSPPRVEPPPPQPVPSP